MSTLCCQSSHCDHFNVHFLIELSADQVTDLMFVFAAKAVSREVRLFAGIFVVLFALVRTGTAVANGLGLVGALLALTGAELGVRWGFTLLQPRLNFGLITDCFGNISEIPSTLQEMTQWSLCRGWQAFRSRDQDVAARWKEVASFISIESILEGIPLVCLAALALYETTDPCQFLTCEPTTIAHSFPADVLTLPSARGTTHFCG